MSNSREQLIAVHRFLKSLQSSQAKLRITVIRAILADDFDLKLTRRRTQKVCVLYGARIHKCWATF